MLLGPLSSWTVGFFIEFFKTGGLFYPRGDGSPLRFASNNALRKRDGIGTAMMHGLVFISQVYPKSPCNCLNNKL
jgi:hypothetical protein